jgi:hypothetical protein
MTFEVLMSIFRDVSMVLMLSLSVFPLLLKAMMLLLLSVLSFPTIVTGVDDDDDDDDDDVDS